MQAEIKRLRSWLGIEDETPTALEKVPPAPCPPLLPGFWGMSFSVRPKIECLKMVIHGEVNRQIRVQKLKLEGNYDKIERTEKEGNLRDK